MSLCPVCVRNEADLGQPSQARWVGPDGGEYCSLHFTSRFGFAQPLVRVEDYEPPKAVKAPAKKGAKSGK
jgi:hypothetical protein